MSELSWSLDDECVRLGVHPVPDWVAAVPGARVVIREFPSGAQFGIEVDNLSVVSSSANLFKDTSEAKAAAESVLRHWQEKGGIVDIPTPLLLAELCKRDPEACSDKVSDQLAKVALDAMAERDALAAKLAALERRTGEAVLIKRSVRF